MEIDRHAFNKKEKKILKSEKIGQSLLELTKESNIHGLPNVFKKERIFFKVMWFIFFIVSLSFGIYLLTLCVIDYSKFDVVSQTDIFYEIPTQFPTVTFYNLKAQKTNYSLEQILISCTFDDQPCYASDFESDDNTYKFNGGKNSTNQQVPFKTSSIAGKETGLKIELFSGLPDDDYDYGELNKYDGYHVVVHNNTVDPRFHDGLDISPGFASNLVVSRTFSSKLPMPYNECILDTTSLESYDSKIYKHMLNSRNYTYRHVDCYDYCLGKLVDLKM